MPATERPRRHRLRRVLLWALVIVVLFHLLGGWYLSGVLHERALSGEERRASNDLDPDLLVQAVAGSTIVLRPDGGDGPSALEAPGVYGLRWEGGNATLGEVLEVEGEDVARVLPAARRDGPRGRDAGRARRARLHRPRRGGRRRRGRHDRGAARTVPRVVRAGRRRHLGDPRARELAVAAGRREVAAGAARRGLPDAHDHVPQRRRGAGGPERAVAVRPRPSGPTSRRPSATPSTRGPTASSCSARRWAAASRRPSWRARTWQARCGRSCSTHRCSTSTRRWTTTRRANRSSARSTCRRA